MRNDMYEMSDEQILRLVWSEKELNKKYTISREDILIYSFDAYKLGFQRKDAMNLAELTKNFLNKCEEKTNGKRKK